MSSQPDYRVILRRFEFERLMVPPPGERLGFGGRYSNRLLENFYATDVSQLHRTFLELNLTQQTLYALNAVCGEVCNGGISQFFFNTESTPFLRDEVAFALERIGAKEAASRYAQVKLQLRRNPFLSWIRRWATEWSDYISYKDQLGGKKGIDGLFDDWFFETGRDELEALMRAYLGKREHDLVRICDGDRQLEKHWRDRLLRRVIAEFDEYQDAYERVARFAFFDLLFTPERRTEFGQSSEERREQARLIAIQLMPIIRRASEGQRVPRYLEMPSPHLLIEGQSGSEERRTISIAYHENECDLMWSIDSW